MIDQPHPAPYVPDHPFPPGETLRRRLAELGLSQADLAARSNLSTKHINQIIQGVAPITHETALAFERVTGTPARIWSALEAAYRDGLAKERAPTPEDETWMRTLPITELQRRGLVVKGPTRGAILQSIVAFFGVADRTAWERVWLRPAASFRRSKVFRSHPGATAAWLRIGEVQGRSKVTKPFDAKVFRDVLSHARRITRRPELSADLVARSADAGVVLVFVNEIRGCRANGAAQWLSPTKALIQLSDRHKREDSFWFSFFHEGAHVLLHSKRDLFINDGARGEDALEEEANRFAEDFLVPPSQAHRLATMRTDVDVEAFANELGIAAGIVVGRLHNDERWEWSRGRRLIRKIAIIEAD